MMNKALFIGDISLDTTIRLNHIPVADEKLIVSIDNESPGGVISNAAVACHLAGVQVQLGVETGDDLFADSLIDTLLKRDLDVISRKKAGRTCRAIILLEEHGEKRLLLEPGVSIYPDSDFIRQLSIRNVSWIHTAAYGPAAFDAIAKAREARCKWSLDLEPATFTQGLAGLAPLLEGAEVVFCNQRALAQIGADPVGQLRSLGVKNIVSTLGAAGAVLDSTDDRFSFSFPGSAAISDTTGAGDCLAGWFIASSLQGMTLRESLIRAVYAATYSCTFTGAQDSYPTEQQLYEFIQASQPIQSARRK